MKDHNSRKISSVYLKIIIAVVCAIIFFFWISIFIKTNLGQGHGSVSFFQNLIGIDSYGSTAIKKIKYFMLFAIILMPVLMISVLLPINNFIGKKYYRLFTVIIISILILTVISILLYSMIVLSTFNEHDWFSINSMPVIPVLVALLQLFVLLFGLNILHFKIIKKSNTGEKNLIMENKFAAKLKELREERALGQVELAKELNVSNGIISLWENGQREPTMNSLMLLAQFFCVSIDYLVGLED